MLNRMRMLAKTWHNGVCRDGKLSDVPYIMHPAVVVSRLIGWGEPLDSPSLAVAWGHDLLEDTKVSPEVIEQASSPEVLEAIRMLTKGDKEDKPDYVQRVADSGDRTVLLVKIADRLSNSYDFLLWEGTRRAYVYLHKADVVHEALTKLPQDEVTANALKEWDHLNRALEDSLGGE